MLLLVFRLLDPAYGTRNKNTLAVNLRDDNTLSYSHYGGWQSSGMGFAISNLGMSKSLPTSINGFRSVEILKLRIQECLKSGYGCNKVDSVEVVNKFPKKTKLDRVKELVNDLCFEEQRMSSSGQETYQKLCKELGI